MELKGPCRRRAGVSQGQVADSQFRAYFVSSLYDQYKVLKGSAIFVSKRIMTFAVQKSF